MIYICSSTMSLGDRFHVSRKAGKWVGSLKGENSTAVSELPLVGIGLANSVRCSINIIALETTNLTCIGPKVLAFKAHFSARLDCHCSRDFTESF